MSLLERIAAKQIAGASQDNGKVGSASAATQEAKPNAMIVGVLKSFGLTPESLLQSVGDVLQPLLSRLDKIDARLTGIEEKLAAIEANQTIMLKDHGEDERVQLMVDSLPDGFKLEMN